MVDVEHRVTNTADDVTVPVDQERGRAVSVDDHGPVPEARQSGG
jgi:hypothetical protein